MPAHDNAAPVTPSSSSSSPRGALFVRSFHNRFPRALRGEGVYLWDAAGQRYLDFSGSAAVNFIGHGVADVAEAIAEQARSLEFVHSSQFATGVGEEFAREVLEFAGPGFRGGAVYFTSGGSEAVETALKLARQYQVEIGQAARFQILSREQSYHGSTLGAMAVSGNRRRRQIYLEMLREFQRVSTPYCYRCRYDCQDCAAGYAGEVERAIEGAGGHAAAFILEPVSGATLGAAVPPDGYLARVAEICAARGVLLIADEVMTGFGRTGRNFAVEHWGVVPDILVLGKGIASGYAPLGAVVANARVVDAIAGGSGVFVHGFTYNAHPVALAAGRAVLRRIKASALVQAAGSEEQQPTTGAMLARALRSLRDCRSVGDVRGIGLLWAMEFVADNNTKAPFASETGFASRVADAARRRGLLVYPMQGCVDGCAGDHVLIAPPAVITSEQIAWATAQLADAIRKAEGQIA